MNSRRVGLVACAALLVLLAVLAPAASAGPAQDPLSPPAQISPSAGGVKIFMPLVQIPGAQVRFWADRYTLQAGGCTTLHWATQYAKSVFLDGAGVAASGTQQACPTAAVQFYTLEVEDLWGGVEMRSVDLTAGDPGLAPVEVIAQATVASVAATADVDPFEPGNQPGYELQLSGVNPLFVGTPGWNEPAVTLGVPQELIDFGPMGPVDWPVKAGQPVEFRADCEGAACLVSMTNPSYLYLRAE